MSKPRSDINAARQDFSEARDALGQMMDDCFALQDELAALVTTSDEDADVAVTHDSQGRLVELWLEPGLAQQLTVEELEDRINAALAANVARGGAEFDRIFNGFLSQYAGEKWRKFREMGAAEEMAAALQQAQGR